MEDLERLVQFYANRLQSLVNKEGIYIVVKGADSSQRENFVGQLSLKVDIPIYSEEQFPNTGGKRVVDLGKPIPPEVF